MSRCGTKNVFPTHEIMTLYKKQKVSLKKSQSPRATASWISGSSKQTGAMSNTLWVENTITYTAATPEIATDVTLEIRDAITAETSDATTAGIPTSEETSV